MTMKEERIKAWHFLPNDGKLRCGDGVPGEYGKWKNPLVRAGVVYVHKGPIEPCRRGLHASIRAMDALSFAPGSIACRVECWDRVQHEVGNKLVCGRRKVLAVADATKTMKLWALWCAEEALKLVPNPGPRSLSAIEAGRDFLDGKITLEELNAARSADADAWSAADAARYAADAARYAAARSAAAAARYAAGSAAAAARYAAARYAARSAQNQKLEDMLLELIEEAQK